MSEESVSASEYDEGWLENAWGEKANQALLSGAPIVARPRVARAVALADFCTQGKLLDIACGRGEFVALAAYAGMEAFGVDYSEDALAFAERVKRAHEARLPAGGRIELKQGDATALPFGDDTFDRVTMLDIIEHLTPAQLAIMLGEVRRVLKPDGVAVIHTLPNRWVYDVTFPLLHRVSRRFPRDPRGPYDRKIHINEQTLPDLASILNDVGLNHELWLEQLMASQARWNAGNDSYGDTRDNVYPMLAGLPGRILEALSATPFKLLLSNDIFGVAWKGKRPRSLRPAPLRLTEQLTIACGLR